MSLSSGPSIGLFYCSACNQQANEKELILVYAREWKDCLGKNVLNTSSSTSSVCSHCLVGYNIPVVRPTSGIWEFGKVLAYGSLSTTEKKGNGRAIHHQLEFLDRGKEWVLVERDPYDQYTQHFFTALEGKEQRSMHRQKRQRIQHPAQDPSLMESLLGPINSFSEHSFDEMDTIHAESVNLHLRMNSPKEISDLPTPLFIPETPTISPMEITGGLYTSDTNSLIVDDFPLKRRKVEFPPLKCNYLPVDFLESSALRLESLAGEPTSSLSTSITSSPIRSSVSSSGRDSQINSNASSPSRTAKLWTTEEDNLLLKAVASMKKDLNWPTVAKFVPDRSGKQCRERYLNHLGPHLKHTEWTPEEDARIFRLHQSHGSRWSQIVKLLPGRTDNGIKNRYHHIRRRFEKWIENCAAKSKSMSEQELHILIRQIKEMSLGKRIHVDSAFIKGMALLILDGKRASSNDGSHAQCTHVPCDTECEFGRFRLIQAKCHSSNHGCVRCGLIMPSKETGRLVCERTGWCESCTRVTTVLSGDPVRLLHSFMPMTNAL